MQKKTLLSVIAGLSILCAVLWSAMQFSPEPVLTVENRKAQLYHAENAPSYSGEGNLNINTATTEELCTLPGIGKTLAERMVAHREKYGAYPHPEAIMEVRGIGENLYEKIKDKICTK